MIHSPAQILAILLTQDSGAPFTDPTLQLPWSLFVSVLPDEEGRRDDIGAVFDTTGIVTLRMMSGNDCPRYGVQLRARALSYPEVFRKLGEAWARLRDVHRQAVEVDGTTYTIDTITRTSPIISMGQDDKRRANASLNVTLSLIEPL